MILPAALAGIFLFWMNWCLCVWRTLRLVAISRVPWLVGAVFGPRHWELM